MSNGACNTASNSMNKTEKTTVYPTVHVTMDQAICTKICNTASSNMFNRVKAPICPTVHVTLDQTVRTKTRKRQCVQRRFDFKKKLMTFNHLICTFCCDTSWFFLTRHFGQPWKQWTVELLIWILNSFPPCLYQLYILIVNLTGKD